MSYDGQIFSPARGLYLPILPKPLPLIVPEPILEEAAPMLKPVPELTSESLSFTDFTLATTNVSPTGNIVSFCVQPSTQEEREAIISHFISDEPTNLLAV